MEENELIEKVLKDLGADDVVAENPAVYDKLRDVFELWMYQYENEKISRKLMQKDKEKYSEYLKLRNSRKDFLQMRGFTPNEAYKALLVQQFSDLPENDYRKFLKFIGIGRIGNSLHTEGYRATIKTQNGRVYLEKITRENQEHTIIGKTKNGEDVAIGTRKLNDVVKNETGEIESDVLMDVIINVYNSKGELKSGELEYYATHEDLPFYKEVYNPKTRKFEERDVTLGSAKREIKIAKRRKYLVKQPKKLTKIVKRYINKGKALKRIESEIEER